MQGHIVSHSDYGPDDYKPSTNSQLTLTNVSAVDIHFVVLDLEDYTPCYDYLLIWGANETKICQDVDAGLMGQTITFQASNNRELVLRFVSGSRGQTTGFLLKYTGELPEIYTCVDFKCYELPFFDSRCSRCAI